jgi:hypothetical protein
MDEASSSIHLVHQGEMWSAGRERQITLDGW